MNEIASTLNRLLEENYEKVTHMEQNMLNGLSGVDISINELHVMEYVADAKEGRTITDIAGKTGKTLPSITVAIQKLERRGYVEKVRSQQDGRVVLVTLTRRGRKIDAAHRYFHRRMVNEVLKRMDETDVQTLVRGLTILNDFFDQTLAQMEKQPHK